MANPYSVTIQNVVTDGTNIYVTLSVFDGVHTLPPMTAEFPASATSAQIQTYAQTVANNQPALAASLVGLVNLTLQGQ